MAQSDQVPTQSGFDRSSRGAEVLAEHDLTGVTAVVTGGYSGLGLETTRALAAKGVRVIVPVRSLPQEEMIALGWLDESGEPSEMAKQGFKSPEQGCATTLWAATSALLQGKAGVYCEDCDIAVPTDPDSPWARYMGVDAHACDDALAERLWALSEEMLARA